MCVSGGTPWKLCTNRALLLAIAYVCSCVESMGPVSQLHFREVRSLRVIKGAARDFSAPHYRRFDGYKYRNPHYNKVLNGGM